MINENLGGETINTAEILFTEDEATKNEISNTHKVNYRSNRSSGHVNASDPTLYAEKRMGKSMSHREVFKEFDEIRGSDRRLSNVHSNKRDITFDEFKLGESRM